MPAAASEQGQGQGRVPASPLSGPESVWNTGPRAADPGAGGGGVSTVWPMPSYQSGAATSLGVLGPQSTCPTSAIAGNCREVPDVSADAGTPIAIYCSYDEPVTCGPKGWTPLVGTSAAAPVWAPLFALADASPSCAADGDVGFANPALYAVAGGDHYAAAFHDIASGDDDLTGTNGGRYKAGPGYDLASGLGTPIVGSGSDGALIDQLCSAGAAPALAGALPPVVTSLHPASARSRGGARIVIRGKGFLGATSVLFGTTPSPTFTVLSPGRLVAVAPPGHDTVEVVVMRGAATSRGGRAATFRYLSGHP